jgi:large subunit ribosomal protein L10
VQAEPQSHPFREPARVRALFMNKEQKTAVVDEVAAQIEGAEAVFAVDYRGISVPQVAALRQQLTEAGARFRVVKNTLTVRAAEQAGADDLKELLEGPTAFTFVTAEGGDVALAAKALAQFRREHEILEFKGGRMNGEPLTIDQIQDLARLPARDVLDAQLVGTLASPITGLVRGLNQLIAGLALQLGQIAEQGLVSGEAPAAEEAPPEEPAAESEQTPDPDEADLADGEEDTAEPADAEGGTDEPETPDDAEDAAEPAAADAEGGTDEPETPSEGEEQKEG